MAAQEGFSTTRPPYFDGQNFQYWKSRMEYYLMMDMDMWFSVTEGFIPPTDDEGRVLVSSLWSPEQRRRAQANAKATVTLQCGLAKDQLNKVGPFSSAQELWKKLMELHEGTRDSRTAKRDLYLNQLQNFSMKESETVSELHGRFKEILNGLHSVGEAVENRDLARYVLKSFPRNTLWSSMVDAYKVSRDLSTIKIDELFCEFELHEQANRGPKEKGIAFLAGERSKENKKKKEKKESSSSSSSDSDGDDESSSDEMANFVRRLMRRSQKYNKKDVKKYFTNKKKGKNIDNTLDKTNVECFHCHRKGHFKSECPKYKKKEEKAKRKKALKATWDDASSSSSSEEETEEVGAKQKALMAMDNSDSSDSGEQNQSDSASSSSDDDEVNSPHLDKLYKTIACLTNALKKSKNKEKLLKSEINKLREMTEQTIGNSAESPQIEELKDENKSLKALVNDLKSNFEKFTTSSKALNMMLSTQRAVYTRAGLGYNSNQKEFSFLSLVARMDSVRKNTTRTKNFPARTVRNHAGWIKFVPAGTVIDHVDKSKSVSARTVGQHADKTTYASAKSSHAVKTKYIPAITIRNHAARTVNVRITKAWIPRSFIVNAQGPKIWVPRDHVFHT